MLANVSVHREFRNALARDVYQPLNYSRWRHKTGSWNVLTVPRCW